METPGRGTVQRGPSGPTGTPRPREQRGATASWYGLIRETKGEKEIREMTFEYFVRDETTGYLYLNFGNTEEFAPYPDICGVEWPSSTEVWIRIATPWTWRDKPGDWKMKLVAREEG